MLDSWLRYPVGGVCIVVGLVFARWAFHELGVYATSGLRGQLLTIGPYRYSRNPQYVGDIVAAVGYAILSNSTLVLLPVALGIVWFALAPFTEEPWLCDQFGAQYDVYRASTPRFLLLPERPQSRKSNRMQESER